jgi:hypothetical protein
VVHAISESAKDFYLAVGFAESPLDAMTLMVTLSDIRAALNFRYRGTETTETRIGRFVVNPWAEGPVDLIGLSQKLECLCHRSVRSD